MSVFGSPSRSPSAPTGTKTIDITDYVIKLRDDARQSVGALLIGSSLRELLIVKHRDRYYGLDHRCFHHGLPLLRDDQGGLPGTLDIEDVGDSPALPATAPAI